MKFARQQPLLTSVVLHVVVLIALFLSTIVEAFRPKERPHVFEMVSPPDAPITPQPTAPTPDFDVPDIEPMPEVPEPVVPETPPEPTPTPAPPKTISYEEFKRQHQIREPRPQQPTQRKPVDVPKINVNPDLSRLLQNQPNLEQAAQLSAAQQTALQRYGAQLNARLNRAWVKPQSLAGVRLTVTVVFDVSSTGRISNARLRPSSGNAAFDQSVLAAFRSVVTAGPTPTGQNHTFTMDFRMLER